MAATGPISKGLPEGQQPGSPLHSLAHLLVFALAKPKSPSLLPRSGAPAPSSLQAGGRPSDFRGGRRDRKSTRLNSSHSQISYAVFCLKKKKKLEIVWARRQHM